MTYQSETAVKNAGRIALQRIMGLIGAGLFAVLIPRLLGPEDYGRYSFISVLSIWFAVACNLGFTDVICRFTPTLKQPEQLKPFFGSLLRIRLGAAAIIATAWLVIARFVLPDVSSATAWIVAGIIIIRPIAMLFAAFSLGMNRGDRWSMETVLRGWLTMLMVYAGYRLGGLTGAFLGLLAADLAVFAITAGWAAPVLSLQGMAWRDLFPRLQFGLIFFAGMLTRSAMRPSGVMMMKFGAESYAQVGFFNLAVDIFAIPAFFIYQLTMSFSPMLSSFKHQEDTDKIRRWTDRILRGSAALSVLGFAAAVMLADDIIPLALGPEYREVVPSLLPAIFILIPHGLHCAAYMTALVYDRPGMVWSGAALRLVLFWLAGPLLAGRLQSLGGCVALAFAYTAAALFITARTKAMAGYALGGWLQTVGAGLLLMPLALLKSTLPVNAALLVLYALLFGGLLLTFRIITREEVSELLQMMFSRPVKRETLP